MAVTIYHNPRCGTSRNALALLEEAGAKPKVVDYLKEPLSRADLDKLVKKGITPRDLLRAKEALASELKLENASDAKILDAIAKHPILLNRPIVAGARRVVAARPAERALDVL